MSDESAVQNPAPAGATLTVSESVSVTRTSPGGGTETVSASRSMTYSTSLGTDCGSPEGGPSAAELLLARADLADQLPPRPDSPVESQGAIPVTAERFNVRGANYLEDRKKYASAPAGSQLVRFHMLAVRPGAERHDHIAAYPGFMDSLNPDGEFLLLNIQVPGDPPLSVVLVFEMVGPEAEQDPHFRAGWEAFRDGTDQYRDERFKIIPQVHEGPWVVKKCVGSRPAILGLKLKQRYFRGPNYLEIDLDIGSDSIALRVVRLCRSYARAISVDLGIVLQGNTPQELPEVITGAFRLDHIDMSNFEQLPEPSPVLMTASPPPAAGAAPELERAEDLDLEGCSLSAGAAEGGGAPAVERAEDLDLEGCSLSAGAAEGGGGEGAGAGEGEAADGAVAPPEAPASS